MKSIFFHFLSVLVVAFVVGSCAGQSNRANPSGAGAAQTTKSGSSGSASTATPSNCSWTLPGDGMGPSRLICSNVPNATVPSGIPSNGSGAIPGTGNANGASGGNAGQFTAESYDAFRQGANSVADLNVMKRGSIVNSALRNWQAPTDQQDSTTSLAQSTSLADPFADTGSTSSGVQSGLDLAADSALADGSNPNPTPTPNPTADGSENASNLPSPIPGPPPSPDPSLGQTIGILANPQLWKGVGEITASCFTIAAVCAAGVPTGGAGAVAAAFAAQGAASTFVAGTVNIISAFTGDSTLGQKGDQITGATKNPVGQFMTAFTGDLNAGKNAANMADGIVTFATLPDMDIPGHSVLPLFNAIQAATSLQEGTMSMQSVLSSIPPSSFTHPSPMPTPPPPSQTTNGGSNSPTPQPAPTPSPASTPTKN
jgi:hypothetical protein